MLSWIIQISIISIIFIFLVHHLLCFFKTTLTVPKMKDLVNSPAKKYQDIFDTIINPNTGTNSSFYSSNSNSNINSNSNSNDYTDINLLPTENPVSGSSDMKDELKSFLKKQLNTNNELEGLGLGLGQEIGSIY